MDHDTMLLHAGGLLPIPSINERLRLQLANPYPQQSAQQFNPDSDVFRDGLHPRQSENRISPKAPSHRYCCRRCLDHWSLHCSDRLACQLEV